MIIYYVVILKISVPNLNENYHRAGNNFLLFHTSARSIFANLVGFSSAHFDYGAKMNRTWFFWGFFRLDHA